jgi:hypothetical protein
VQSGPCARQGEPVVTKEKNLSITLVIDNDCRPDGNVAEGKSAAAGLVACYRVNVPEVQRSLRLEDIDHPLQHAHITFLDSPEVLQRVVNPEGIQRFVDRVFPEIVHGTGISPGCRVGPADGTGVKSRPDNQPDAGVLCYHGRQASITAAACDAPGMPQDCMSHRTGRSARTLRAASLRSAGRQRSR